MGQDLLKATYLMWPRFLRLQRKSRISSRKGRTEEEVGGLQSLCCVEVAIDLPPELQGLCTHNNVMISEEFNKSWNQGME